MHVQSPASVALPLPDLSPENLLYKAVQYRPYRKGGLRLQHQVIGDKHVFHNYGHGGAGISLAYGSAYITAKSVGVYVGPSKSKSIECAILGCGIMGLFTAVELAKKGYTVSIYSQRILEPNATDNLLTSQVAAGKWQPGGYDFEADYLKHQTLAKLSFDYYQECIATGRYRSIRSTRVYESHLSEKELRRINTQSVIKRYNPVEVTFSNGKKAKYLHFDSILLITDLLLQELLAEAKLRGVQVIQRKFSNLKEVLALKEQGIFNCTGLSSRELFGDTNIRNKKGNLLVYKNVNKVDYMLSANHEGSHVTLYGVGDKLMVGATYLDEPIDPKLDEKRFEQVRFKALEYFGMSSSKPAPRAKL